MPLTLYLMRHGVAEDFDPRVMRSDFERPLSKEGRHKLEQQAEGLKTLGLSIDLALASPLLRAQQTGEIIRAGFRQAPVLETCGELVPEAGPDAVLLYLQALVTSGRPISSAALFGHEPHMSSLVSFIATGRHDLGFEMRKGMLVGFELTRMAPPFRGVLQLIMPGKVQRGLR